MFFFSTDFAKDSVPITYFVIVRVGSRLGSRLKGQDFSLKYQVVWNNVNVDFSCKIQRLLGAL